MQSDDDWLVLGVPPLKALPNRVTVRSECLPAHSVFPWHSHAWNQLVHAVSGPLVVAVRGQQFVIMPEQAVWIPKDILHSVRSFFGAEFRSLYLADDPMIGMPDTTVVLDVSDLLRALINEAASLDARQEESTYTSGVFMLILAHLKRLPRRPYFLQWPGNRKLQAICEALYKNPSDTRGIAEWATTLGASDRTLSRQFEREMGVSFRDWRYRLRAFKALELLATGMSITAASIEIGYASTAAFTYMFRKEFGCSPSTYRNRKEGVEHDGLI
ncbi:MAG: helix-turn-helix transcriptional regulator [Rhodoferax sp.]|jgi:AraC-like DNA-binding protein|nr:helix-turn-helix transcriptional regulator [Rhodoferax sp.]